MKIAKVLGFVVLAVVILAATSCTSFFKTVPGVDLPLAKADYTILGETTGQAEAKVILGLFYVGEKKFGSIGFSAAFGPLGMVKETALYDALQKMPEADAVMAPVFDIEYKNSLFVHSYKVTVRATGIEYKEGPVTHK